jgi:hypothetical protein
MNDTHIQLIKEYVKSKNLHYKVEGTSLYLHYPLLEIKNIHGNKHVLRDVVIKIRKENSSFSLARYTITYGEEKAQYIHSHISRSANVGFFNSFCIGRSPVMKVFTNFINNPTSINLTLFLSTLENILQYEDLKGVPYISVKSVIPKVLLEEDKVRINIKSFLKYISVLDKSENYYKIKRRGKGYQLITTEKLIDKLMMRYPQSLCIQLDGKHYLSVAQETSNSEEVYFTGTDLTLYDSEDNEFVLCGQIIPTPKENNINKIKMVITPSHIKQINEQINLQVNKNFTVNKIRERVQANCGRESLTTNKTLLF